MPKVILIAVKFRRRCKKFEPIKVSQAVRLVALKRYGIVIKD